MREQVDKGHRENKSIRELGKVVDVLKSTLTYTVKQKQTGELNINKQQSAEDHNSGEEFFFKRKPLSSVKQVKRADQDVSKDNHYAKYTQRV